MSDVRLLSDICCLTLSSTSIVHSISTGVVDGGVSVEIGDDSSEMINTLSAQVDDNYLETAKVLEQDLSTDDDDESDQPVFITESHDKTDAPTCLLVTSTEKVKGETKGRRRTVSKDDVLGKRKQKKPRKGSRKNRSKNQKSTIEPTTLVVSIKKNLFEPLPGPLPLTLPVTMPTPPPPPTATGMPLIITINRHLLRHSKFRLPASTPEEKPKKSFEMLKIRLAKFGNLSSSTPKQQRGELETTPTLEQAAPPVSRKRELEISPSEPVFAKRSRPDPQVQTCCIPYCRRVVVILAFFMVLILAIRTKFNTGFSVL